MKRFYYIIFLALVCALPLFSENVPLKNIVTIEGMEDNPLLGYGVVVGLKGTGDNARGSQTPDILAQIANTFGFSVDPETLKPKNSAVVLVSGMIPPYATVGSRIDIRVSSIYDAKSLKGGELVITPLVAGDNRLYAIARGRISVEDNPDGVGGYIPLGGIVQREVNQALFTNGQIVIQVNEKLGIGAIAKVREAVEKKFPGSVANTYNNKITLKIPQGKDAYSFIFELYNTQVNIDQEPSVLIDADSGIIVAGGNVIVTEAAVSFNGTRLNIGSSTPTWGQKPSSATTGQTVQLMPSTATVAELVEALNQIGASPKDIIKILKLLHKNGNLKAKLIIE